MVGRWGSSIDPAEVVRIDPAAKAHRNLTDFNIDARARTIDWQPPQHFWFTTQARQKIHNMIVAAAGFDPSEEVSALRR